MKRLPLFVLAVPLLAATATAQGSILPYLPKDTVLAIAAPDLATSITQFEKMPLARMWAEQEVQSFFADLKEMASKQIEKGMAQARQMHAQGALPFDPEQLMQLRVLGVEFAVTHLEVAMGDFGPIPKIGAMLHLEFGATTPQWNALIETGLGMLAQQAGDELVKTDSKVGDVTVLKFTPTGAPIEMSLNIAMLPSGILIGTLADDVTAVLTNMQKKTPVLGATAERLAIAKNLDTDGAEVESYLRMQPVIDVALQALQLASNESPRMGNIDMEGVRRAIDAMGLRNLGAMGSTTNYVDGKSVSKEFHAVAPSPTAPGANSIDRAFVDRAFVDRAFLKWVPKDAVSFSASTLNLSSIYDTLLVGLRAYNEEFAGKALEHLAGVETKLGFKIRDDFFGTFGDHYISWSLPMGSITSPPELAFLLKVNNDEKLVTVMKSLTKLSNGMVEIEEGEKRGLKTYSLKVNYDPTNGAGMNPFEMITPTFAFKNGYMVLGLSSNDVRRVFQRMDREDDDVTKDIRGNKEFAAVAAQLPAVVDSVSFTDWKAQFESFYQIVTGVLAFVPMGEDIPIDMSLLPDSATLTKHLFGSLSYSTTTPAGNISVSVSPFGPEAGMLIGGLVGGAAATFGAMRGF